MDANFFKTSLETALNSANVELLHKNKLIAELNIALRSKPDEIEKLSEIIKDKQEEIDYLRAKYTKPAPNTCSYESRLRRWCVEHTQTAKDAMLACKWIKEADEATIPVSKSKASNKK